MKILWYALVLILGGVIGFLLGGFSGSGVGMLAGGSVGVELGVCTTLKVAEEKGLLAADQQEQLLTATADHLRNEFKELVEKMKLSENLPLNAETCETLLQKAKEAT